MAGRHELSLPEGDRKVLERLCRYDAKTWDIAVRAMIVLKSGLGEAVDQICRELDVNPRTVYKWRQRYRTRGLAGLDDGSLVKPGVSLPS